MPWWLRVLVSWVLLAVAFYITTLIVPGIQVTGGVVGYLKVALVFGLINAVFGPVLRLLTFPITIITLGLFHLLLNGFLLWVSAQLVHALTIQHFFWDAIVGALVLGLASWALNWLLHRAQGVMRRR